MTELLRKQEKKWVIAIPLQSGYHLFQASDLHFVTEIEEAEMFDSYALAIEKMGNSPYVNVPGSLDVLELTASLVLTHKTTEGT